jgi:hypothetical protein
MSVTLVNSVTDVTSTAQTTREQEELDAVAHICNPSYLEG